MMKRKKVSRIVLILLVICIFAVMTLAIIVSRVHGQIVLAADEFDSFVPSGLVIDNVYTGKSETVLRKNIPSALPRDDMPNVIFVYDGTNIEYIDPLSIDFWQFMNTLENEGWTVYETSVSMMYVIIPQDETLELYLCYQTDSSISL